MKQIKMQAMNIGHQTIMLMRHLALVIPYIINVLDGGADTCAFGQDGKFFLFTTPEAQI
jgi:hypothetical protein